MAAIHDTFELPPDKAALHRRAVRLEWWTVAFFVVAITALAVVLGQSQAMKAAWVEDILASHRPSRSSSLIASATGLSTTNTPTGITARWPSRSWPPLWRC
ncbi:hypothetical protein [Lentzea cavernae]|uniref:Uncharacterized protein n=1 Tax=Lentzea cavernae TaxID=2020703 RepID=A0ABQ3M419_9PSEU|nr:hypothetical protein [Lentzea cavernae]GHH32463.1 hypothetical protein GCM10017774_13410 [Lentzea cavernae]